MVAGEAGDDWFVVIMAVQLFNSGKIGELDNLSTTSSGSPSS